jgi:nucleotide-binding universal stress UspA family protein
MFRTVLATIKPSTSHDYVIDLALTLATERKLAIEACAVIDHDQMAPFESTPIGGGSFKKEADEQRIARAREAAAEMISRLETKACEQGLACTAQIREGNTVTILSEAMRSCDVLLCGHTAGGDAGERSLLQAILKHASRPAIVVPQSPIKGRDVLIAYDGSVQAGRALASFASSGFAEGRNVFVASFSNDQQVAAENAESAQIYLDRHGVPCQVHTDRIAKNLSRSILEEAARVNAGFLVMGAFGRGAVTEFFLGSHTRSMLEALPMPIFLDH